MRCAAINVTMAFEAYIMVDDWKRDLYRYRVCNLMRHGIAQMKWLV